jgi:hypothetical protein
VLIRRFGRDIRILNEAEEMAKLVRKNVFLESDALKRAQRILGEKNESKAIRAALRLVAFREEVLEAYDRVAGKARGFRDVWKRK